jgi:hypothetical protein
MWLMYETAKLGDATIVKFALCLPADTFIEAANLILRAAC